MATTASSKGYRKKSLFPCLEFVGASWDREQKQIVGSIPLRITFSSISGLKITKMKESFNIRVSVFDIAFRQFIGRTCNCPMANIDEEKEAKLDQSIYMHTSFNDINIILCFEVVLTSKDTVNRKKRQSSLGWGLIPVFTTTDGVRTTAPDVLQTSAVYKGTPRALLYMEEPIESNSYLQKILGCQVKYTLQIHKPLIKVIHCLPVNILFAGSDAIPGVMEQQNASRNYGDLLKRPRPQKSVLLILDHLCVNFTPSVENFEEELCRNLDIDRLRIHNFNLTADNSHVAIVERRLKIGIHNGYAYLREPQIVHLILQNSGKDTKNRDATKWILSHQNKIKLPEMTEDVHLMVVFLLEYIISSPVDVTDRKLSTSMALTRSQTSTVVARWASWKPFLSMDSADVTVTLIGGISQNPDRLLVFAPISGNGELKFTFVIRKRRDSGSSEQTVTGLSKITESNGPSSLPLILSGHLPPQSPRRRTSNRKSSHRRSQSDGSRKNSVYASTQSSEKTTSTDNALERDNLMSQDVVQIPCVTGPYVPITQVSSHLHSSGHGLSRAGYARLYGAGIPTILDRNGKPPDVVNNLCDVLDFSLNRELSDPLKTNVIIFQFLAYSCNVTSGSSQAWSVPKILKFSFQFFRFPSTVTDRMLVSHLEIDISSDPKYVPCLLQKVGEDGSVKKGAVGYEVKFCVDRDYFFEEKDREVFVKYLLNQCLHIDVWDGESQLYIGSASAELKHLCRQGKEAVQVTYELDVRFDDFCDEVPSSSVITRGYLHLRMANVGYPNTSEKLQFTKDNGMLRKHLDNKIDYKNVVQARSYLELDKKLAAEVSFSQKDPVAEEKVYRKITRMEAVRASRLNKSPAESKCFIDPNKERLRKIKALKLVETSRERNKHEIITGLLFEAFGKEVTINTVPGQAELFEFELVNPWKTPQTVTIECENAEELRVVADHKEWHHFKSFSSKMKSAVEENMFVTGNGGLPQMFIGSRERVCIPFRYQNTLFETPSSSTYNNLTGNSNTQQSNPHSQKVIFRTTEGKIMSVLLVRVDLKPPTVDRIFQFHCAERSFIKRSLRIPSTEISGKVSVLSSDPHVICEVTDSQHGNPIDILFKISSGPCCTSKKFYLFIYGDRFQITPLLSWLIVINSLQRVDIACVQSEKRQQSLILRGSHSTRLVKCFSSHPTELVLSPSDPFLLAASTIHELQLTLNVKIAGTRYMYINVVDTEFHQLVHSWLVCVACKLPVLTRAFQIQLPLGGGKGSNKRLPFTNPYVTRKKFFLHTSHPDLLHFKESCFEVAPKQMYTLGLIFLPNFTPGQTDILVFIHGEDDRNEETFCIKANYA